MERDIVEALEKIVKYEEGKVREFESNPIYKGMDKLEPWWEWQEVGVHWRIVHKLLLDGYLDVLGGRRKYYKLKDREEVKRLLKIYRGEKGEAREVEITKIKVPDDLFDIIIGFDDLKFFIKRILEKEAKVHVLLVGPPGVAKTLILKELERINASYFITGGTSTRAGIRDVILEYTPRILIIDEIEKIIDPRDLSVLLTLMEDQRIIVAKHGFTEEKMVRCNIFAAANKVDRLPHELLDRFQVFNIKPYTPGEARKVIIGYLTRRMGKDKELAEYIADKVLKYTTSVREAIRLAEMTETKEDVDKLLKIILRYRGNV